MSQAAEGAEPGRPARPVFAIFEGGGARGVAHVGALAAAEANGLYFYGVAGASAGAVIATLVSVGFAAAEIMHPTRRDQNILSRAFSEKTLVFAPLGDAWTGQDRDYMTKYERALLRSGKRSVICVPVFESEVAWESTPDLRPPPAGVLSFDSDADLSADFEDPQIKRLLARRSTILFAALKAGVADG